MNITIFKNTFIYNYERFAKYAIDIVNINIQMTYIFFQINMGI